MLSGLLGLVLMLTYAAFRELRLPIDTASIRCCFISVSVSC